MSVVAKMSDSGRRMRPVSPSPSNSDAYEFTPSLLTLSSPNDAGAEAVRALRTHIVAQHIQEGRRALAVCAASAGVGCTFIAANLAVSLSQIGVKTLLIEGDMRRPGLNRYIRTPDGRPGLAQCLGAEEADFGDVIQPDILPNLSVIASGGPIAAPQELLAGERFRLLMEFCLREFEVTLIDTPPANTCADGRRISTVAGYSLIVTRRNKTYVEDIKVLAAQLEADRAKVVGTILNDG
jgi:capsular exopolysaccharide synthesis family protein